MKTRIILILLFAAVVTLSFTFTKSAQPSKTQSQSTEQADNEGTPIGGFVSEDKF